MKDMLFEIEFGKATYAPDAPKNLPRWWWRCACGCGAMNGPFRTRREAERDAEATILRGAELADAEEESRHSKHH
jgi:hypothetical protein